MPTLAELAVLNGLLGAGTGAIAADSGSRLQGAGAGALGGAAGTFAGGLAANGMFAPMAGGLAGGIAGGMLVGSNQDGPEVPRTPIDLEAAAAPKTASIPYRAGFYAALAKIGVDLSEGAAMGALFGGLTGGLRAPEGEGWNGMVGGALGGAALGGVAPIAADALGDVAPAIRRTDPGHLSEVSGGLAGILGGVGGEALTRQRPKE